nr:unnamed protein product [Callosobruchus analis]
MEHRTGTTSRPILEKRSFLATFVARDCLATTG